MCCVSWSWRKKSALHKGGNSLAIRFNYQTAALRVCVDSRQGGRISGRIVGQRLSESLPFSDVSDFVAKIDALLDLQVYPQAFRSIRSFTLKERPAVPAAMTEDEMMDAAAVEAAQGAVATFRLQIFTRQNASWQGRIDWLDGSPAPEFNSTLEFIKLTADKLDV